MQQSKSIKIVVLSVLIALVFISCNNKPSLQSYFVDHQESANFMTADIPPSMVSLDDIELTDDQKEAYNAVKRLSFLGYKIEDSTKTEYFDIEIAKVKTILKDERYIDLAEFSDRGAKFNVKYIGDDNVADEIVILGSSKYIGFGVVRVLGNDMSPEKIAVLINTMQNGNFDQSQLDGIMDFFK